MCLIHDSFFYRWKNEVPCGDIIEAVAIRSKVYCLKIKKHEDEDTNQDLMQADVAQGAAQDEAHVCHFCMNNFGSLELLERHSLAVHGELEVDSQKAKEENFDEMKRMKGVRRPILKQRIHMKDYINALYGKPHYVTFQKIAAKRHRITTNVCRKKAITSFDDKR